MKRIIIALIALSVLLISCGPNNSELFLQQKFDDLDSLYDQIRKLEQDWYLNLNTTNEFQNGKKIHDKYYDLCIKYHYQREQFINFLKNNPGALDSISIEQMEFVNEISWDNYEVCIENVNMMRTRLNKIYRQQLYGSVTKESPTII